MDLLKIRKTQVRQGVVSNKPLFARGGSDLRWFLNITMDKSERLGWFIWLSGKGDSMLFCPNTYITRQGKNINFRKKMRK